MTRFPKKAGGYAKHANLPESELPGTRRYRLVCCSCGGLGPSDECWAAQHEIVELERS